MTSRQQSSRIGEIVQAVKSGQKDKSAAFAELQGILRTSSHPRDSTEPGPETDSSYLEEADYASAPAEQASSSSSSRISQEDRRMLINKLIEKKRQNRQPAPVEYEQQENDDYAEQSEYYGRSNPRADNSYYTRGSMDDTYIQGMQGDSRSNRIAQTEAAIRQEMFKECRFRPVIKELPAHYGANKEQDVDFYERVTKWQKEKDSEFSRRKMAMENSDMVGCTFQPKINRNSERAVKEIRGDVNEIATDRLYKSSEVTMNQRRNFIEDELQRERKEEQAVCTFQPKLVPSKRYTQVKSKFTKIEHKKEIAPEEHPEVKLCTFTPKVKGVRASMPSAQMYVSSDVVERLTRPIMPPPSDDAMMAFDGDARPQMDMAQFMVSLNTPAGRPSISGRPSSAPPRGSQRELSDAEKDARRLQFKLFLGRQEQQQLKRVQHIEEKSKQLTPGYQPRLCRKSIELAVQHQKGVFLERLERDVHRRAKEEERKAPVEVDPECTFYPETNKGTTTKIRARSSFELSRGDLLRKETNARMMKLKTEQEQMVELTFKPVITKKAKQVGSCAGEILGINTLALHNSQ